MAHEGDRVSGRSRITSHSSGRSHATRLRAAEFRRWAFRMTLSYILLAVLLVSWSGVYAQEPEPAASAIAALRKAAPKVAWDVKAAKVADVTCDGVNDTLLVGYKGKNAVSVGVVPGAQGATGIKPLILTFRVGAQTQESFCGVPVRIEMHPIECSDEDVGELPGCKPTQGCSDFSVIDDLCDSFHFYWNAEAKELVWWRR